MHQQNDTSEPDFQLNFINQLEKLCLNLSHTKWLLQTQTITLQQCTQQSLIYLPTCLIFKVNFMKIIKQLAWKLHNFIISKLIYLIVLNRYIIISISHQQYMSVIHIKNNFFCLHSNRERKQNFFMQVQ